MTPHIRAGRDQNLVDPDINKVYTRRKELHLTSQCHNKCISQTTAVKYPSDGWSCCLQRMPTFTRAEIDVHITKTGKSINPSKSHSLPTGVRKAKRFLDDEYLSKIQAAKDTFFFYFRSFCYHSYMKNDPPHKLKIALDLLTGEIRSACCSCTSGDAGLCNHILALMFMMCKFSMYKCKDTTELDGEEDMNPTVACTSSLQVWHKTRRGEKISAKPIMEVLVKKTKLDDAAIQPREAGLKCMLYEARNNLKTQNSDELQLKSDLLAINKNMPLAQIMNSTKKNLEMKETKFGKSPSGCYASYQLQFTESNFKVYCNLGSQQTNQTATRDPPTEYPKFPLIASDSFEIPEELQQDEEDLLRHLSVNRNKLNDIEEKTSRQSASEEWKIERKYRFTASNFKRVCVRQRNHATFVNNLLNQPEINSKYLEHGKKFEPIALKQYQKYMYSIRRPIQLFKCGLVVIQDAPFLGATPDGKVIEACNDDKYGLVEIKCPHTKFHVTPLEACSDASFCCEEVNGMPKLKQHHEYYYQVQGQMGATKAKWCDFVVYTNIGMSIERVSFNGQFWETVKTKLKEYYFSKFINIAAKEFTQTRNN